MRWAPRLLFGMLALALLVILSPDAPPFASAGARAAPGSTTRVRVPNLSDRSPLGADANDASSAASMSNDTAMLAEFNVAGELFRAWTADSMVVQQLLDLYYGLSTANIPVGPVGAGPGLANHNLPWSWHMDISQMAEFTIELCDGRPSDIEADVNGWIASVGQFCPWSAQLLQLLADHDFDAVADGTDNCPDFYNPTQTDTDGDFLGNPCDPDYDNDGVWDAVESPCGADPLDLTPPFSRPERVDLPGDDDGDLLDGEALPTGAESYDCDGDGYTGTVEAHVFSDTNVRDQDPCGTDAWPADFIGGASANLITLTDLASFVAPVRHFGSSPGDAGFDVRWDVVPGGTGSVINLADLGSLVTVKPAMFGGAKAFNGPTCPWP